MSGIIKDFFVFIYQQENIEAFRKDIFNEISAQEKLAPASQCKVNIVICKEKTDDMGIKGIYHFCS